MSSPVYKVMSADEWEAFKRDGTYDGSDLDRADGFVHLSAPDQVAGTVARHFKDRTGLVAVAVDRQKLGPALKWEQTGHGAYPHFHGTLERDMVISVDPIPDDPDQRALTMALLAV